MHFEKEVQEIKAVIDQWSKAVQEQDIDAILANHASNMIMFDVPPPFQSTGIEEYKKTWDLFFSWSRKPVLFHFTDVNITASETVAFAHGIGHCASMNKNGEEESITFRLTMGFAKENGKWIILHEHHSVPSEE